MNLKVASRLDVVSMLSDGAFAEEFVNMSTLVQHSSLAVAVGVDDGVWTVFLSLLVGNNNRRLVLGESEMVCAYCDCRS